MKLTIEMPIVARCTATECAYNVAEGCHARAITVGDGERPGCDTFLSATRHTRDPRTAAGVGACKVEMCRFNQDYECFADRINVGQAEHSVQCLTFESR